MNADSSGGRRVSRRRSPLFGRFPKTAVARERRGIARVEASGGAWKKTSISGSSCIGTGFRRGNIPVRWIMPILGTSVFSLVVTAAVSMLPDFVRYMKIRSM
jgi:hypothetical protein